MPPLGVVVLDKAALAPEAGLSASPTHLENAYLRATIGPDGTVTSLIHKPTGREALAGRGNQLWAYPVDKPRNWDAWDIDADYLEKGVRLSTPDSLPMPEKRWWLLKRAWPPKLASQFFVSGEMQSMPP